MANMFFIVLTILREKVEHDFLNRNKTNLSNEGCLRSEKFHNSLFSSSKVGKIAISVAQWLACWTYNENVVGSSHGLSTCDCRDNNLGQVVDTNVPLSTQVYKWVPDR